MHNWLCTGGVAALLDYIIFQKVFVLGLYSVHLKYKSLCLLQLLYQAPGETFYSQVQLVNKQMWLTDCYLEVVVQGSLLNMSYPPILVHVGTTDLCAWLGALTYM